MARDLYKGSCEDRRLLKAGYQVCSSSGEKEWHWRTPTSDWHDGYRSEEAAVNAALRNLKSHA
jgi:hypothetical protein